MRSFMWLQMKIFVVFIYIGAAFGQKSSGDLQCFTDLSSLLNCINASALGDDKFRQVTSDLAIKCIHPLQEHEAQQGYMKSGQNLCPNGLWGFLKTLDYQQSLKDLESTPDCKKWLANNKDKVMRFIKWLIDNEVTVQKQCPV
ncbi:hypothetical protein BBP40_007327 [Aspergillus hancockii]|nr:hypothetical protein BBP40_007327 [Aspergillus hancockii]